MIQAHVFYSGMVQGVGFRYTAQKLARDLDVAGWVKNLPDGRVELLSEGKRDLVEQFLQQIEKRFDGYIQEKAVVWQLASGNMKNFLITA